MHQEIRLESGDVLGGEATDTNQIFVDASPSCTSVFEVIEELDSAVERHAIFRVQLKEITEHSERGRWKRVSG